MLDTHFAPAQKASPQSFQTDIASISNHAIVDTILHAVGGLLAILNEQRQILAVNETFLESLGVDNQADLLSLRLGEAIHCIHAHEEPQGCGTTKYCSTCGAAIAMVTCLTEKIPVERICALTARRDGKTVELSLAIRAQAITLEEKHYILLFIQDITKEQFLVNLERTFFHDINNILCGLLGSCELFALKNGNTPAIQQITNMVLRITQEIAIQRTLSQFGEAGLKPIRKVITSEEIITEISSIFASHPAAHGKTITTFNNAYQKTITSDISLLLRVVCNMVTNALEATEEQGEIKLWIEAHPHAFKISVWNREAIEEDVKLRIFQRHFSTKNGSGRGLGTYSMKVFGEQYLGGKIDFSSSKNEGTLFSLTL